MRLIAANWKMYLTPSESVALVREVKDKLKNSNGIKIVVCPPFISICSIQKELNGSKISIGAQNCHWDDEGAYTGEVSAKMLADLGCQFVIVGHSERRNYFRETDEMINMKLKQTLKENLSPILCVGETWQERDSGNTEKVLESQLTKNLTGISKEDLLKIVIAYEPVWAIGSGKNATSEQAQSAHSYIRQVLTGLHDKDTAEQISIIYGGSVSPENARELLQAEGIDGALVGGSSLKVESFIKIISAAKG